MFRIKITYTSLTNLKHCIYIVRGLSSFTILNQFTLINILPRKHSKQVIKLNHINLT